MAEGWCFPGRAAFGVSDSGPVDACVCWKYCSASVERNPPVEKLGGLTLPSRSKPHAVIVPLGHRIPLSKTLLQIGRNKDNEATKSKI